MSTNNHNNHVETCGNTLHNIEHWLHRQLGNNQKHNNIDYAKYNSIDYLDIFATIKNNNVDYAENNKKHNIIDIDYTDSLATIENTITLNMRTAWQQLEHHNIEYADSLATIGTQ